jgi:hypothetical protein
MTGKSFVIILFETTTELASRAADSLWPRFTSININFASNFIAFYRPIYFVRLLCDTRY